MCLGEMVMEDRIAIDHCPFCQCELESNGDRCPECQMSLHGRKLVDWEICHLIGNNEIIIEPLIIDKNRELIDAGYGPGGIDLRLDTIFKEFRPMNESSVDPQRKRRDEDIYRLIELDISDSAKPDEYILHPGEFVLGQSLEYIVLPNCIAGQLDGRSSYGRFGVTIHNTACTVDQGFRGHLAFEMSNSGKLPVRLLPTQRVARLSFHLTNSCQNLYKGKYQLQVRVKPPVPD